MINVTNNFLDNNQFFDISKLLLSKKFPYFLTTDFKVMIHNLVENIDNKKEFSLFLQHVLFNLIIKLKAKEIISSTVYLITKDTENISLDIGIKNPYEISLNNTSLTSMLYINSNNGHTKIIGKDKIEPVQNRLLTFSSNISYEETTPTDQPFKIVLKLIYCL